MMHDICPRPYVRQSQRDKWAKRPCVLLYRAYHDRLRELGVEVHPGDALTFFLPMPFSWSHAKKLGHALEPCLSKPDLDNLIKGLIDGVVNEDQKLWSLGPCAKCWAPIGSPGLLTVTRP